MTRFIRQLLRRWREYQASPDYPFGLPNWMKLSLKCDLNIEDGYVLRWWLLPRNPLFGIYLHRASKDDPGIGLHDHRYCNISIILRGSYREVMPDFTGIETPHVLIFDLPKRHRIRKAGHLVFRRPTTPHRLEIIDGPVWTIFITGPAIRRWGFHTRDGWKPHFECLDRGNRQGVATQ